MPGSGVGEAGLGGRRGGWRLVLLVGVGREVLRWDREG